MTDTDLRRLVTFLSEYFNTTIIGEEFPLNDDEIAEINRLLELFEAWTLGVVRWTRG